MIQFTIATIFSIELVLQCSIIKEKKHVVSVLDFEASEAQDAPLTTSL